MYNADFELEGKHTLIQCNENDLMEKICKSFSSKVQIDLKNLILSCNGKAGQELFNKITLKEILNEDNRKTKIIKVVAYKEENEESNNDNLNINNEINKKGIYTKLYNRKKIQKKGSYSNLNINSEMKKKIIILI
jgi:hypothetical protein